MDCVDCTDNFNIDHQNLNFFNFEEKHLSYFAFLFCIMGDSRIEKHWRLDQIIKKLYIIIFDNNE